MDQTKKAIKSQVKEIYNNVLTELTDAESKLTPKEKKKLCDYILMLNNGTCHTFSHIFIKKKIKQLVRERKTHKDESDNDEPERLARIVDWGDS